MPIRITPGLSPLLLASALLAPVQVQAQHAQERLTLINDTGEDLAIRPVVLAKGKTVFAQRGPRPGLMGLARPVALVPGKDHALANGSRTSLYFKDSVIDIGEANLVHLVLQDAGRKVLAGFSVRVHVGGGEASGPDPAPAPTVKAELSLKGLLAERRVGGSDKLPPQAFSRTWQVEEGVLIDVKGSFPRHPVPPAKP